MSKTVKFSELQLGDIFIDDREVLPSGMRFKRVDSTIEGYNSLMTGGENAGVNFEDDDRVTLIARPKMK